MTQNVGDRLGGRVLRRIFFGRPLATEEAPHQLLPKVLALPVFASDPLSSNAYATEEILIVLSAAGAATFWLVTPLAGIIAVVVVIVIASYRQTIKAYPHGGGSYIVARENLGDNYGLAAAAALLTDYVLTVSVSVVAGVAAITSAAPGLAGQKVTLSLLFVALLMIANLRGVKESGTIFAIPTYTFVLSIWALLVVGGINCIGGCPEAASADLEVETLAPLTIFVILRAFASGSTALTGIEAVSNGVPAFRGRRPSQQAHNAIVTITIMGFFTLSMFLGLSLLARGTRVHPITPEIAERFDLQEITVVAQITEAVSGRGFLFFAVQATTAAILILAANTAYADFPRLSSILARDRFMPRQFLNRGDRLVFSNGIVVLSILASILVVAFDASVTALIQLYVVGVFTTFTLSQAGMVRRWFRLKEPSWRAKASMNAVGASTTGLALIIIASTKFVHGAWIVITAMPLIVLGFKAIHRHYLSVAQQLRAPADRPVPSAGTRVVVLVPAVDESVMRALGYARALRPIELRALFIGEEDAASARAAWEAQHLRMPLDSPVRKGDTVAGVRRYVREIEREGDEFVTVVVPERIHATRLRQFLGGRKALLLKAAMLFEPQVVLTDVPLRSEVATQDARRGPITARRNVAIVLVAGVHNATLRAMAYAQAIRPTEVRAVTFNVDEEETRKILRDWAEARTDMALEAIDSQYREVTRPLVRLVRQIRAGSPDTVVTLILPEFVVSKWYHQFLHNQTALGIKAAMLFEPGVVVTSVPFHLR